MLRAPRRSRATPRVKDGRVQRKNHRDVKGGLGPLEIRVDVPSSGYRHIVTPALLERFFALVPDWSEVSRGLEVVLLADGSERRDGWYESGSGLVALTAWPDPVECSFGLDYHAAHRDLWTRLGVASRPEADFLEAVEGMIVCEEAVSDDVHAMIERELGFARYDLRRGASTGEWLAVERVRGDAMPDMLELVQLGDEVHMYEPRMRMRFDRVKAAAYQLLHVLLHELGHHVDAITTPQIGRCVRGEDYAEQWALRTADRIWDEALALIRASITRA